MACRGSMFCLLGAAMFFSQAAVTSAGDASGPDQGTGKVLRETKEAMEATKEYTLKQKETFTDKVRAELKEMQEKIAELRRKTESASAEARAELQNAITDLEKKKNEARKKLDEASESTGTAFGRLRDGVATAVEELKKSYKDALSKMP
ncbi:MAG TPA: hypothetical protein VFQ34_01275 [Nitrospiraceae bacterium]|nr:hypothetical protein [Nitrospiraceae bacterium]